VTVSISYTFIYGNNLGDFNLEGLYQVTIKQDLTILFDMFILQQNKWQHC